MRLVKRFLTVLLETFFSYLIISQVGYIHSNDVVMETLSDSSALKIFVFSNNIAGGLYSFNSCR